LEIFAHNATLTSFNALYYFLQGVLKSIILDEDLMFHVEDLLFLVEDLTFLDEE